MTRTDEGLPEKDAPDENDTEDETATPGELPRLSESNQVFEGYFENPDYSDPASFLAVGDQTQATEGIWETAENINDNKDFSTLQEIYSFVSWPNVCGRSTIT